MSDSINNFHINETLFCNSLERGKGLSDQVFNLASSALYYLPHAIAAVSASALSSFVISSSIFGLRKTTDYLGRKIVDPVASKILENRVYLGLKRLIYDAKNSQIEWQLFSLFRELETNLNDFLKAKNALESKMKEIEIEIEQHLEKPDSKNNTIDDMLQIFRVKKEQIKKLHKDAIKCAEDYLLLGGQFLEKSGKLGFCPAHVENTSNIKKGVTYIQNWKDSTQEELGTIFNPYIETTRNDLINYLKNWNPVKKVDILSFNPLEIDRTLLTTRPKTILAKLSHVETLFFQVPFKITNEPAADAGGVTRDVYTKLFSSLLEESDTSIRSILNLGPYSYVYKGLGEALRQIARNPNLFIKEYFDRELFSVIDGITVDELTIIHENIDLSAIERIKQRVILELHPSESSGLNQMFRYKNKTEKSAEDIEEMREFLEGSFDYTGDDIDGKINEWLEQNHYYTKADRLIDIAMHFKGVGQSVNDPMLIEQVTEEDQGLREEGVTSLSRIQTPLNRQELADAVILGYVDQLPSEEATGCLEKKRDLIKSWILNESTSEKMLFDFTVFCTGSAVLGVGQKIIISFGQAPFHAHTCFNRLDLSTSFEQGVDQTLEQAYEAFIRDFECVIEPDIGADFNRA